MVPTPPTPRRKRWNAGSDRIVAVPPAGLPLLHLLNVGTGATVHTAFKGHYTAGDAASLCVVLAVQDLVRMERAIWAARLHEKLSDELAHFSFGGTAMSTNLPDLSNWLEVVTAPLPHVPLCMPTHCIHRPWQHQDSSVANKRKCIVHRSWPNHAIDRRSRAHSCDLYSDGRHCLPMQRRNSNTRRWMS